jgi:hypothetical protein
MKRKYGGSIGLAVLSLLVALLASPPAAHAIAAPDAPGFAANSVKLIVDNDYVAFYGNDPTVTRLLNQNNVDWTTQIANASAITISPNAGETYLYVGVMGGGGTEDFGGLLAGQDIIFIPGAQVASGRSPLGTATLSTPYVRLESFVSGYSSASVAAGTQNVTLAQMQTALTGVTWSSAVGTTAGAGNVPNYKTSGVCCGASATGAGLSGKGWNFPSDSLVVFRYPLTSLGVPATPGDRQVLLDWVAPAGGTTVDSYQVEYKRTSDPDSAYTVFSRPPSSVTAETVTGLINGVDYTFRIASVNSGGISPYAPSKTATPYGQGVSAPSFSGAVKKGIVTTLTLNASFSGKARFYVDGKKIPNCLNVTLTGTSPNFSAICTFKPAWSGQVIVKAYLTSSDGNYSSTYSDPQVISVIRRSNQR